MCQTLEHTILTQVPANTSYTLSCMSCPVLHTANSQIRNLLGGLCFLDIILKLNYLLSIIILMPSFKIQNQRMYVYMGTKERSCHGFKWEYH